MCEAGRLFPVYGETNTSEKIKEAEELKKITEEQKQAVDDMKEDLADQRDELQSYLSTLNGELAQISDNLEELEEQIAVKEAEVLKVQEELAGARAAEDEQYSLMKSRIKHIYEKGGGSFLSRLAGITSYTDLLSKAEYIGKLEEYDQRLIGELIAIRKEIEEKEEKLARELNELMIIQEQSEQEQEKVTSLVASTSGSLAAANGALSAAELEQEAYEKELREQEKNLSELKKQLAAEQAMSAKAAKMSWRDVSQVPYDGSDRDLLAALIYCEAGAEPYTGQVAVGAVVINRMRSAAYPNTMVGVIYQRGQFSPVASGRLATRLTLGATESCYRAADEAMSGVTPVGNCLYFRRATPQINGQIIGNHVFY
ncbi:MAG: cell wall hydrolase [Lachnospiraceae bacterium]|nr:cell wall hydrolase [Lachnospiraceae bacterium]